MAAGFVYILASKPYGTLYAGAMRRQTSLKHWKRDWKIALIEKVNPEWKDLIENWHR